MRLIDADALRESVLKWLPPDPCGVEEKENQYETDICVSMLMEIEEAPTIEPEPHWIPCSERLPEEPGVYTVTDSKGDVVRFVFYGNKSIREYWKRCAKAWMPLPEPYKEGES